MRELSARPHYEDTDHSMNDSATSVKFSEKTRLWALTYVCIVAVQAVILSGFALGFTSPVLSKLKDIRGGNKSLEKTQYQDIFNVRAYKYFEGEIFHEFAYFKKPRIFNLEKFVFHYCGFEIFQYKNARKP